MLRGLLKGWLNDDAGATAIEYGLIAAIIGLGLVMGMEQFRTGMWDLYNNIKDGMSR